MSLPTKHGPLQRAESQELGKGRDTWPPGLSPLRGYLGHHRTDAQQGAGGRGQVSGHFQCHKEALVLGYPDSPA